MLVFCCYQDMSIFFPFCLLLYKIITNYTEYKILYNLCFEAIQLEYWLVYLCKLYTPVVRSIMATDLSFQVNVLKWLSVFILISHTYSSAYEL